MNELAFASIKELREKLDKKEISPKELAQFFIKRFQDHDSKIDSALEIFDENSVLERYKPANNNSGDNKGFLMLDGIAGAIKDNICQEGRITSCGSKILENFRAPYDATVIKRLKAEGATFVARVNCDEFAMGSSNETSAFKLTKNPWDTSRVPGGSSGGPAAAVAAGFVPWSLGSDTGGSIRLPAAYCGLVGIKPTYGLVSRYGLVALTSSFDQIGALTRTVYDNAIVMSAIAGKDEHDSTTLDVSKKDYTANLTGKIKPGLKIGIVKNAFDKDGMDPEVMSSMQEVIKELEKLGAKTVNISMETLDYGIATYIVINRAEAASNLARFDGVRYGFRSKNSKTLSDMYSNTRYEGFGKEVKSRIMVGNYVLSAGYADKFYDSAKKVQRAITAEFKKLFGDVDLIIMPTQAGPAFKLGAMGENQLQMQLQDYFTASTNIAGVPAITVPCGFTKSSNLPLGFQIIGPHLSEELIFQTAYAYEQNTQWYNNKPSLFL